MNEFTRSVETSDRKIIERAYNKLELREDKETAEWVKVFTEQLSRSSQLKMLHHIHRVQSLYVASQMARMKQNIKLLGLGSFYYKKARRAFYEIKENNPNLSLEQVIAETKKVYEKEQLKKKNLKKLVKNREISLVINK